MTRFARVVMPVVTGLLAGLLTWPAAAQTENGPAVMAPPTGTVRVHLLVPRDQRYVDGITQVVVEAQRYWWTCSTCSRS